MYDAAMDVGEAEVTTAEMVREMLVVKSHDVQDRGVQVVDMHHVVGDDDSILVALTINRAPANPAARKDTGKRRVVVVTAFLVLGAGG